MIRRFFWFVSLLVCVPLHATERRADDAADALIDQARNLPIVQEFFGLYPQATISAHAVPTSTPYCVWTSDLEHLVWLRIGLYGRHILEMSLLMQPAIDGTGFVQKGEAHFFITYVSLIESPDNDGRSPHIAFDALKSQTLPAGAWSSFVRGGGHFEDIGVKLFTNSPLKNFECAWPGDK